MVKRSFFSKSECVDLPLPERENLVFDASFSSPDLATVVYTESVTGSLSALGHWSFWQRYTCVRYVRKNQAVFQEIG